MYRILFAIILAFISGLWTTQATSADMSVFGIPLGEGVTFPECPRGVVGYGFSHEICFERMNAENIDSGSVANGNIYITFPVGESPSIMSSSRLIALMIDGRLEGIGFNTGGIKDEDRVFETLKGKYGSPTSFVPRKLQNMVGGTFDAFTATWSGNDFEVTFNSVSSSLESGLVNIDTKKGSEHRRKIIGELIKDKHPL